MLLIAAAVGFALAQTTICVDPGHPSEVGVGTQGRRITELHADWVVAGKLRAILQRDGYRVVLTKSSEKEKVLNRRRAEIANGAHAALFLRLHCDAGTAPGFAVYYPAGQGRVGNAAGPSREVLAASLAAARRFYPAMVAALKGKMATRGLHTEMATKIGGRQGALTGSIYSKVPVLLVEMAVLQNAHDDAYIASPEGQEQMAQALAAGVEAANPQHPPSAPVFTP